MRTGKLRYKKKPFKSYNKYGSKKSVSMKCNEALSKANKALKYASQDRPEVKPFDTLVSNEAIGTVVYTQCLNTILQEVNEDDRIGNKLKMISIQLRGKFHMSNQVDAEFTRIMLVLYMHNEDRAASISATDIWTGNNIEAIRSTHTPSKFKVLWDHTCNMNTTKPQVMFEKFIKVNYNVIYYSNATEPPVKNALFLMVLGSHTEDTTALYYNCRVRFTDS